MKKFLLALILGGLLGTPLAFATDLESEIETLKEEVSGLKETIQEMRRLIEEQDRLIRELGSRSGQAPPSEEAAQKEVLEKELEGVLKAQAPPTPARPASAPGTATGVSSEFNPAISINGLFLAAATSKEREERDGIERGIDVQEIELQATGFVDPFLRGDVIIAVKEGEDFELEEAFVTAFNLPFGFGGRAGKFFGQFGKHNSLHTHQFPFIDAPVVNRRIFGEEAFNEVGLEGSYFAPLPWFSELKLQLLDGESEELFDSPDGKDLAYLGRWTNLWDLTESSTLELGGSYVAGKNTFDGLSQAAGGDLTVKWRPLRGPGFPSLTWQTEYIYSHKDTYLDDEEQGGIYSSLQYQFARQWWVQGRFDYFGIPRMPSEDEEWRTSGLLAFVPSEFSAVRFQYSLVDDPDIDSEVHQLLLQLNYTFGSHPAHKY